MKKNWNIAYYNTTYIYMYYVVVVPRLLATSALCLLWNQLELSSLVLRQKPWIGCKRILSSVSISGLFYKTGFSGFKPDQNRVPGFFRVYSSQENCMYSWKGRNEEGTKPHFSCLLYTSPSPRDGLLSRMPSSAWKKKFDFQLLKCLNLWMWAFRGKVKFINTSF